MIFPEDNIFLTKKHQLYSNQNQTRFCQKRFINPIPIRQIRKNNLKNINSQFNHDKLLFDKKSDDTKLISYNQTPFSSNVNPIQNYKGLTLQQYFRMSTSCDSKNPELKKIEYSNERNQQYESQYEQLKKTRRKNTEVIQQLQKNKRLTCNFYSDQIQKQQPKKNQKKNTHLKSEALDQEQLQIYQKKQSPLKNKLKSKSPNYKDSKSKKLNKIIEIKHSLKMNKKLFYLSKIMFKSFRERTYYNNQSFHQNSTNKRGNDLYNSKIYLNDLDVQKQQHPNSTTKQNQLILNCFKVHLKVNDSSIKNNKKN